VVRDLKPANIFLAQENGEMTPKVLDFGISGWCRRPPFDPTTDSTLGSPHCPPGSRAATATGRTRGPVLARRHRTRARQACACSQKADTFMGLMYAIAQGTSRRRMHRPTDFERIVLRAMARQKNDRFPSVAALGRALLPFASPRTRTIWEPQFGTMSAPKNQDATVPDLPRMPYEETGGTLGQSASALATGACSARPGLVVPGQRRGTASGSWPHRRRIKLVSYSKNSRPRRRGQVVGRAAAAVSVKSPGRCQHRVDSRAIGTGEFTSTFKADGKRHTAPHRGGPRDARSSSTACRRRPRRWRSRSSGEPTKR
jgi:hypothetical protein